MLNIPEGIPVLGQTGAVFIPGAGALVKEAVTLAEINAPTSIILSCFVLSDSLKPTGEQSSANRRRKCSALEYEVLGATKRTIGEAKYVYNPQGDADDPLNKARAILVPGLTGDLLIRRGLPGVDDFASAQRYELFSVRLGPQNEGEDGDDGEFVITQTFSWTGNYVSSLDGVIAPAA